MIVGSSFRIVNADLHAERADVLSLDINDIFIGSVSPSALDILDENIQVVIPPILFDRTIVGGNVISSFTNPNNPYDPESPSGKILADQTFPANYVIGSMGVGAYWKQLSPVTISTYAVNQNRLLRQDTFGNGQIRISPPDEYRRVHILWRAELISSTVYEPLQIQSVWLYQLNNLNQTGLIEVELQALPGQDVLAM